MAATHQGLVRRPTERLIDFYRRVGNPEFSGLEERALNAFERVLGRPGWAPQNAYAGGYDHPIELGILSSILAGADAAELLRECAAEIADHRYAPPPKIAELHTAAMLAQLGVGVRLLEPRPGKPTPDIAADWDGQPIDVEVVYGQRKQGTMDLQAAMTALADEIGFRPDADIAVYLDCELSAATHREIVAVAASLQAGECSQHEVGWRVVALPSAGASDTALAVAKRTGLAPSDWSDPTLYSSRLFIADTGPQRTEVTARVPREDYLNPVKRKAERPQRTAMDRPYLIAFNTGASLGARSLVPDLKVALTTWDHVAGVLMHYHFFPAGPKEWRALLIRNPAATDPLPGAFLSQLSENYQAVPVVLPPAP